MVSDCLKGKVAVITGGGRGIGRAIAETYATHGCAVQLIARSVDELTGTAEAIRTTTGVPVQIAACDVSDEAAVKYAVDMAGEAWGRVDILVNSAGIIGPVGPIMEIDGAEWLRTIQINLSGTFFAMKAALPYMKRQGYGRIVNFSGGGALLPSPFFDAYSVSKAGVVRLTENVALELKGTGIMACAVSPGAINTRMFDDMKAAGVERVGSDIWQSFVKRQETGGDAMDNVTKLAMFLATTDRLAALNGRAISAKWDHYEKAIEYSQEVLDSDIYTMRRIVPKDRGQNW